MAAALRLVTGWGQAVIDFLYPPACPLCYRRLEGEDRTVCFKCMRELVLLRPEWSCPRCGAISAFGQPPKEGQPCRLCPPEGARYQGVLSVVGYSNHAGRCVHLFKYKRRHEMGELIARLMVKHLTERLETLAGRLDCVAPVPLHFTRRLTRGFNQSQTLARPLAAACGLPCHDRLLRRVRATRRQALIPRERRAQNVENAFRLRPGFDVRDKGILIVDDVVTTGHTINECARVLKEAGAREVWVASFARAGMGRAALDE